MSLDIVYVAWNRRAFTQVTFEALLAHTDWEQVDRLVVVDDCSTDGTQQWLRERLAAWPGRSELRLRPERLGSPVAVMGDYLRRDPAEWFVKLDNDVAVPPGWLAPLLAVRDGMPELGVDLVGFEAGMTVVPGRDGAPWDGTYGFQPSSHIGGVGLMRTAALTSHPLRARDRYWGFTEFQHEHDLRRGWLTPDLHSPLLDRLPVEPWRSLSQAYVQRKWQRPWPAYDETWMAWSWDWLIPEWSSRFWEKVAICGPDECWPWTRSTRRGGYGAFGVTPTAIRSAHRVALGLFSPGGLPEGASVLHSCDNPPCCNPTHLFVGDHGVNARDMVIGHIARRAWA